MTQVKIELKEFESIPTSILSDVLGRSQTMDSGIGMLRSIYPIVGRAYTVKAMVGCNLGTHLALYYARKGDIIVVDAGGYEDRSVWGGLQSYVAQKRGIKATIVDGAIRDKIDHINMGYCVCARNVSPAGPHKGWFDELQVPISCGGVVVNPNDIIVIDADGIVVIPSQKAEEALEKAKERVDEEVEWKKRIDKGEKLYEILGLDKNVEFFQNRR